MMEKETSEGEHQKESDQDRKELEKMLQDVGIDPHIWLPRLRGHLNITRAQALQYVGFKDYQKLQHYCEHEWEKEALQKLLNIQEKESQSKKRRDDQSKQSKKLQDEWSEAFKKRQQEARSALNELQHMQEKGRNRNDGIVKEKEEQLQLALQVPKEYWVHSGVPLQDLIENMHKQLDLADCSVLKRDHLSDEEVLKCASGGLALEGIYKSNQLEDAMVKRERLLDVPESFSFSGPEQMPLLNQQDVSSREEESTFRKAMEKIGLSITCSAKAGFWGFGLEINTNVKSSSQSEQTCQSDSAHSYACTTKYNYIPLASCFFGKDQLHLSNSALRELKSIDEAYLKNNEEFSKQRCLEFFQRFGTHANQGPLHFGGIFWWKASSEGFSAHEMNEVKTLTSEALSTYVGASYSGPVLSFSAGVDATHSKSAGFASHDRREALWRNIELSVSKTGGPAEADSLLQWKTGLIASNKTWCVIDRGLQIVPVWDIIICNHKEDFRDAVKLANSLSAAYDMLTKHDKKAEVLCGGELNTLEVEAQAVLHSIRMWNVSTAEQHLMKLIEFKKKLTDEKKNVSVWTSIFLSDEVFQDFLTKLVATHTNSPCDDTVKIRFLMRHLLEDNIYDVGKENFPNRSSIVKWIHQSNNDHPSEVSVSEFSQLAKLLNQAKNDTQEVSYICGASEDSIRSAKVQSTRLITDALYTLRKSLIDTQKIEEELLLLTISAVKGYSDKDNTFDHLLGWPEIEFLLSKLESAHTKYSSLRNESVAKAQAFLISTGLTVAADCTEVSSYEKKLRLAFMKAHLKETVSEEIAMLIDFSAEPVSGWDRLEEDLNNISKGTYQAMIKNVHNQEACLTKDLEDISKMKTQPKSTAKEISVALSNKEWGVIERLGLQKYYPKKMSMSDILVIDKSALEDCQPSTEQELLFSFLQKLLMLDYKARDVFCNLKSTAKQTTSSTPTVAMSLDDFFCDGNTKINKNTEDEPKHIHPMDVQMAIYHCADNFLWQYIATKLSFCQYALPCLVPNPFTSNIEFPSWSFVQLKKSWKCSERADQQSKTAKCKSQSLYEAELPTVSFIRFGPSASSKSQILNNLLNSQKHNTFFHRHCKGSSAPRLFMDGVVERSWYFPGGKDDDVFDDCVAFTNLHGDAREHEKQFEFLLKTATINVVLLTGSDRNERGNAILQKLFNSPKPLICLCADMKVTPKEQQGTKVRIAAESRNEADLVEDLVTTIKRLLGSLKHTSSIKTCTGIARNLGFLIEEDHEHCKQGKSLAEALLAPLKSEKLSVIKDKYLPLQGELWHTWCKKNKELLHLQIKGNISVEQHKSHIEQAKNDIRKKQFSKASPMNNVIRTFLTNLQCNSEATKVFFLKWMEIFLYDLTSEQLSVLDDTQHEKWSKMQALKQRGGNTDRLQNELVQLSNERIASTFSLEHFLRELGQIYEALESQSSKQKVIFSLPEIAADMMISGYPIELMDGDASHVPLKWISSVLDKVIEKLGDKRVFVLSVLGIQSTGKSTLLNAMFGLQFAVSAGRCTRGAFMQLVRVKEDLRREKQLDYVLVVDTEGLRTLEVGKSTLNHDNELATFVIGLGNMTLINIFGENPSDMQDVIQIAVQAFLRMKQIHLTPSCMFVHQNVGEVTAGDKNMEGKRRMLEKLDDMSRTAAKQELCDVSCFNDVIRFDVNTHIHYFAHLWEGNPPMAPPNPSYSENVQKLKRMLLCSVTHQNTLTISGFKTRVQDLWSALLAENFVFSFKNTLEIAAYRKLEEMYADWTWRLRSRMLDIENKLKIKIEHDRGEVVEKKDLESDMQTEYNAVTKEMECYFSEHNDREILIQWKRKIEQQLADVKDQIIGETKRKFDKLVRQKKSCWDLEEKKSKYEDQLLQRSKELALRLKAKDLDEEKLKSEFRKLWSTWVYDVSSDMPPAKKTDVKIETEQILIERLVGESLCKRMEIGSYRNLQSFLNFSNYISINTRFFNNMITSEEANQLSLRLTQDIIHSVNESIKVKERANVDYSPTFIHEIVNKIGKDIQDFQSKEKRFVLKNNYKTDLCLMLCYQAAQRFQEMHNAFQTANDPLTYLKNKKEGYFGIFATFCKGATSTTGLADFVGSQLKEAIRQEVYNKTNADLAGEIRSNTPAFKGNRSNLESHILKTLAEDENFDKFMEYIHHPKQYFEEFINQSIDSYCWDGKDPRILKVFRKSLEHFKIRVLTAISKSTEVVQDKNGDVPMWLDEFCGELKEDLEFTRRDLKSVEYQEINDIRFLEEAMTTVLEHVVEDLEKDFRLESSTNTKSSRTEIQEKLFDHLCGCWEQCPFCSAICTNTISDHDGDHSVDFHRPTGIRGVEWYETDNLIIDICSSLVGSDCQMELSEDKFIPFRNYREAGPSYAKWSITPDSSLQPYWKWFVCQFQSDLEKYYSKKCHGKGEIPAQWKTITKSAAIESLKLST